MTAQDSAQAHGIAAIGTAIPRHAIRLEDLASLRGVDPAKYRVGLGCTSMALCLDVPNGPTALGVQAARRALAHWGGDVSRVGMIAVGTECALDQSRPLSAFIAEEIGLQGRVRSYEVKHACYGGALALRQALEWRRSGAARGKAALVIATDVALYGPTHPGEPTQGAGAVAMVVDDGRVATVAPFSYPYSEPSFDFWRPVGEAYPRVQGKLSLDCYKRAAESCFADWAADAEAPFGFADAEALCFHVPFPRMVEKAFHHTAQTLGLSTQESHERFAQAVAPNMRWNRELGNNYTASLWFSVAAALTGAAEGTRLAALSYGSGFGAELLLLTAGPEAAAAAWRGEMQADLDAREFLSAERYDAYRASLPPRLADN